MMMMVTLCSLSLSLSLSLPPPPLPGGGCGPVSLLSQSIYTVVFPQQKEKKKGLDQTNEDFFPLKILFPLFLGFRVT